MTDSPTTLLRSQIKCLQCGDVIASVHRHDMRWCHCGAVAIDGGRDYLRVIGKPDAWEGASIFVPGELTNAQAGFTLAVYRALAYAFMQDMDWITTAHVEATYVSMQRPYRPEFHPTNLRKAILYALRLLWRGKNVHVYDTQSAAKPTGGYRWKPLKELASHAEVEAADHRA